MTETPDALRHRLTHAEQAAVDDVQGDPDRLPATWCPLGPVAHGLWLGPGLSVLRHQPASASLTLLAPHEARALVATHAFSPTPDWRARAFAAPLGTPIGDAVDGVRRQVPGVHVVTSADREATLLRLPDLFFTVHAGKYFDLEGERSHHGEAAIDLVFTLGACRLPPAPRTIWSSLTMPAAPAAAATTTTATSTTTPTTPTTPTPTTVSIPIAWSDTQRLVRALVLGGAGFLLSPAVAAPLLLAGAVPWLIGVAAVWVALIPGVKVGLGRWEARAVHPTLRVDGGVLHLPPHFAMAPIPLTSATVSSSWHDAVWASPKNGGTRPAAVRLHIAHGEARVTFVAEGNPRPGHGLPKAPSSFDGIGQTVIELTSEAFWRLHRALIP